jgi:hypothetical protein
MMASLIFDFCKAPRTGVRGLFDFILAATCVPTKLSVQYRRPGVNSRNWKLEDRTTRMGCRELLVDMH